MGFFYWPILYSDEGSLYVLCRNLLYKVGQNLLRVYDENLGFLENVHKIVARLRICTLKFGIRISGFLDIESTSKGTCLG